MLSLLLTVPSCIWHGVIPTSYFIFDDFYTCKNNALSDRIYKESDQEAEI